MQDQSDNAEIASLCDRQQPSAPNPGPAAANERERGRGRRCKRGCVTRLSCCDDAARNHRLELRQVAAIRRDDARAALKRKRGRMNLRDRLSSFRQPPYGAHALTVASAI